MGASCWTRVNPLLFVCRVPGTARLATSPLLTPALDEVDAPTGVTVAAAVVVAAPAVREAREARVALMACRVAIRSCSATDSSKGNTSLPPASLEPGVVLSTPGEADEADDEGEGEEEAGGIARLPFRASPTVIGV